MKQKDVKLYDSYANLGEYRRAARKSLRNPNFTYFKARTVFSRFGVLTPFYFRKGE